MPPDSPRGSWLRHSQKPSASNFLDTVRFYARFTPGEDHINSTVSKINKNIAQLCIIKPYLPLQIRKLFFDAHILPHMDYCSIVWGGSPCVKIILAR